MSERLPRRLFKGINVEDPLLFQYNGRWYYFTAMISNPDIRIGAQNLDNHHVELFEYTNEINSLCLYGNIIYTDIDGSISRFVNRQDNHVEVMVRQMEKASDAEGLAASGAAGAAMEMFVPTGKADFMHTFIVQNIKILKRTKQNVTYLVSLISSAWYLLSSQIVFSNYGTLGGVGLIPSNTRNPYRMMEHFLTNAFYYNAQTFKVDVDSFEAAAATTKIEIPYITNGNDNCFTSIKYLFDRLYWNKGTKDDTVKFIVYSPVDNTYRCLDYNVDASWLPCERPFVIMSMFETDYEQQLYASNNELASMAGKNATTVYKDCFKHKIWDFVPELNSFTLTNSLETADLTQLYNSRPETLRVIGGEATEDKYPSELNPTWFLNKNYYYNEITDWNRSCSIYQNIVDNLMNRDALVMNTDGDITHQPGACMGIVLDRTIEKVPELTPEQREELYQKHRQIESLFPILKVTHRFHISTVQSDASYTENVVLGRNFILPPATKSNSGGSSGGE